MDALRTLALESHSHHSSRGVPNQSKQLMPSEEVTGRRTSNQEPSKNFGKKIKEGTRVQSSSVTQRNIKFFLTLKNNEHFHHFPTRPHSLALMVFCCLLVIQVELEHSHEFLLITRLCNKAEEASQVIMTGRQVLLCLRFAVILTLIWVLLYCSFGFELWEKMLLWAKSLSQQNTPFWML